MDSRLNNLIRNYTELEKTIAELRRNRERVVFTNGRFDLLHVGHLRYLTAAKKLGTILIVGVNSDNAVRQISDPGRPITPAIERLEIVASLKPVDYVIEFDEITADRLLQIIKPNVYVKGGDYRTKPLPEAKTAQEVGAEIHLIDLEEGRSTSAIIQTILERYGSNSKIAKLGVEPK